MRVDQMQLGSPHSGKYRLRTHAEPYCNVKECAATALSFLGSLLSRSFLALPKQLSGGEN